MILDAIFTFTSNTNTVTQALLKTATHGLEGEVQNSLPSPIIFRYKTFPYIMFPPIFNM